MDKFESLLTEKGIYGKVKVDISDLPDIEKYLSDKSLPVIFLSYQNNQW